MRNLIFWRVIFDSLFICSSFWKKIFKHWKTIVFLNWNLILNNKNFLTAKLDFLMRILQKFLICLTAESAFLFRDRPVLNRSTTLRVLRIYIYIMVSEFFHRAVAFWAISLAIIRFFLLNRLPHLKFDRFSDNSNIYSATRTRPFKIQKFTVFHSKSAE